MAAVMITCPVTGEPVETGFFLDYETLKTAEVSNNTFGPCSSCGGEHTWNKEDAFPDS